MRCEGGRPENNWLGADSAERLSPSHYLLVTLTREKLMVGNAVRVSTASLTFIHIKLSGEMFSTPPTPFPTSNNDHFRAEAGRRRKVLWLDQSRP